MLRQPCGDTPLPFLHVAAVPEGGAVPVAFGQLEKHERTVNSGLDIAAASLESSGGLLVCARPFSSTFAWEIIRGWTYLYPNKEKTLS